MSTVSDLSRKAAAALRVAVPVDPHLENVIERLFEGNQAKDFGDLIKRYARFHLDSNGAWISGNLLLIELQQMLDYANERALEEHDESPGHIGEGREHDKEHA